MPGQIGTANGVPVWNFGEPKDYDDATTGNISESTSFSTSWNPSSVEVANINAQNQLMNTLLSAYAQSLQQNVNRPTEGQVGAGLETLQGARAQSDLALHNILGVSQQGIETYSPDVASRLRSQLAEYMSGERESMYRGAFGAAGTAGGRGGRFASALKQNRAGTANLADAFLKSSIDAKNAEGRASTRMQGMSMLPQATAGGTSLAQAIAALQTTPVQSQGFVNALQGIPEIVGGAY